MIYIMFSPLQVHKPNRKNSSSNQPCLEPLKFPIPHQTTTNESFWIHGAKRLDENENMEPGVGHVSSQWLLAQTFKGHMGKTQYTYHLGWFLTSIYSISIGQDNWLLDLSLWITIHNYRSSHATASNKCRTKQVWPTNTSLFAGLSSLVGQPPPLSTLHPTSSWTWECSTTPSRKVPEEDRVVLPVVVEERGPAALRLSEMWYIIMICPGISEMW